MRRGQRASGWGLLLALVVLALAAGPAIACGCGAYIPREGEARVSQERALIRWDGQTEDILMELGVQGSSKEAAWILPVPAHATARLGDSQLFEALQELSKPRIETRYRFVLSFGLGDAPTSGAPDGATGGRGGVTLLQRQTLGPFDVSLLDASDAGALSGWLAENGYSFPEGLDQALRYYVDQRWSYVAIRLTPSGAGELSGALQPLWVSFPSSSLVYPMRASRMARDHLSVFLYVLAEHRVEAQRRFGSSRVSYAGWLEPGALPQGSPLAPLADRRIFLTKIEDQIAQPETIDADYTFGFASSDEPYQDVIVRYQDVPLLLIFCLILLLAVLVGVPLVLLRRRRRVEVEA